MTPYDCDCCGRACSRTHALVAYGMDTVCCDFCADYDWNAYDEDADPLLVPDDPREREDEERRHWFDQHYRSEP